MLERTLDYYIKSDTKNATPFCNRNDLIKITITTNVVQQSFTVNIEQCLTPTLLNSKYYKLTISRYALATSSLTVAL